MSHQIQLTSRSPLEMGHFSTGSLSCCDQVTSVLLDVIWRHLYLVDVPYWYGQPSIWHYLYAIWFLDSIFWVFVSHFKGVSDMTINGQVLSPESVVKIFCSYFLCSHTLAFYVYSPSCSIGNTLADWMARCHIKHLRCSSRSTCFVASLRISSFKILGSFRCLGNKKG